MKVIITKRGSECPVTTNPILNVYLMFRAI